jgi:hydrogenase maturation protease
MNLATVDKIAKAVLYEGYMLYPYRPSSVKNQQRWNFGVLVPQSYSEAQKGSEAWTMQTECLVDASSLTQLEIRVRFLQLVNRSVGELNNPIGELPREEAPEFHLVPRLDLAGRVYQPWQEAVEREVILPLRSPDALVESPLLQSFTFPEGKEFEYLRDGEDPITAVIVRERRMLQAMLEVRAERLTGDLFKVSVRIRNRTSFAAAHQASREDALLSSLASTHTVLGVRNGKFLSLLAPPDQLSGLAAGCKNEGTWPVLVGEEGQCDTVLSSPIILYDYPQIAPESAGDLFDGTEIDEILSLRIMTLTDEEKREMSQSDERARQMLERTETMPVEQLMKLHGVLRNLRPVDSGLIEPRSHQEETQ